MNQEAVDRLLIELLRIPSSQRTQEDVEAAIARIASAAQITTSSQSLLQKEQLKLLSTAELLVCQFGATFASVQLDLYTGPDTDWLNTLAISMRAPDGSFMFGRGNTAEAALKDLHDVKPKEAAA